MRIPSNLFAPLESGLSRLLGTFGSVRADERRDVLGAFVTLLGFMTGHAILETARDTLFLSELPATLLPWVYLTLAASALLLTKYHSSLARRLPRGQELSGWLLFAAATTAALWLAIFWFGDWIFYVLYAWTGVLATLVAIQFWTMLASLFTLTQAKRLFAVIGTGSILGAIAGSGIASALTTVLPAQHLVLVAALIFFATSRATQLIESIESVEPEQSEPAVTAAELGHIGRIVWSRPYLKRVTLAILLATITFTLVDFVFKSTVARLVPDESLGTFFSTTYFSLNLLSLLIQVTTVGWILRHITVSTALAIVPMLLVMGAIGYMATGGLALALLFKSADGALRYSLYRTTMELLFVPISAEVRGRVKTYIDLLGQRGGQAAGSVLVLVVLSLTTSEAVVALVAAVTAGAWLYLMLRLKPFYLDLFRQTLREDLNETRIEFPALDVASLETLLYTLNSPDERQVIAALDLLAYQSKFKVVPGLILYHPAPMVLIHAVELFASAGRVDVLPLIDRLTSHSDDRVRAASLRARTVLAADRYMLRAALEDTSEAVRGTAAVALVSCGWSTIQEINKTIGKVFDSTEPQVLREIAEAVRVMPSREFDSLLLRLAHGEDTGVQLATVKAMRSIGDPVFIEPLSLLLAHRPLRAEAASALVALGTRALIGLGTELSDKSLPHAVRRHIPRTIAAFGTPQAAATLLRHLLEESDGMIRFKVLRALGRMRTVNSALLLEAKTITQIIDQNLASAYRYMRWKHLLMNRTADVPAEWIEYHRLLIDLLGDKEAHTLQRLFRLLNLRANDDEFLRIYRGLQSSRREARASSRELIEHMVEPLLARRIMTIIDDLYEPAARPRQVSPREARKSWEDTLGELFDSGIESLSSLAAFEIGQLGITRLKTALDRAAPLSASHADIIADVLRRFGEATGSRA